MKEGKSKLFRCEAIDNVDREVICMEVVAPTPEKAGSACMKSLADVVADIKSWRLKDEPLRIDVVVSSDGDMYKVGLKKLRRGEQHGG